MTAPDYTPQPRTGWWVNRANLVQPAGAVVTATGGTPVLITTLRPGGATVTATGSAPTITILPPITFDAVGAGATSVSTITNGRRMSWTHTATGSNRCVVVAANIFISGGGDPSLWTRTATYGGVTMTSLGTVMPNNANTNGWIELWYLLSPAIGSQTVQVDTVRAGFTFTGVNVGGNSASYTGVVSVGSATTGFGGGAGTTMSTNIASATGHRAVGALIHASATAVGSFSQTSRFTTASASSFAWVVGDAAGATTVTFSGTRSSGVDYATYGFDLSPV